MRFEGPIAALVTPFDSQGDIHWSNFDRLVDSLIDQGIEAVVPASVSGECFSLTANERLQLMSRVAGLGCAKIASTFSTSVSNILELCHEAVRLKYDGILVSTPVGYVMTDDEIEDFLRFIASEISGPLIVYNYPSKFGSDITPAIVARLIAHKNIIGYKDTSGSVARVQEALLRLERDLELICGVDELEYECFAWGYKSILGGSACFLGKQHRQLLQFVKVGDLHAARNLSKQLRPIFDYMAQSKSYIQLCKLGCALRGVDVGSARLPLKDLPPEHREAFSHIMALAN
ncbi:MAG: dihydrodipicolinate synthase family protein [Hyphomicrobiales bacterium]